MVRPDVPPEGSGGLVAVVLRRLDIHQSVDGVSVDAPLQRHRDHAMSPACAIISSSRGRSSNGVQCVDEISDDFGVIRLFILFANTLDEDLCVVQVHTFEQVFSGMGIA